MQAVSEALRNAIDNGNPQRVLLVFASGDEFTNEDIVVTSGLHYQMDFNSETDLTIGLCPSAEVKFTMLNDVGQLNNFEFGTFRAYLGAAITEGTATESVQRTYTEKGQLVTYAFTPLGTFIASRPDVVKKLMIEISANDQMTLFDEDMPAIEGLNLTAPYTPLSILQKLCTLKGVTLGTTEFLNSGLTLSEWPEAFENMTMREVIGKIAEAACCNARFSRDGELELVWFNQTEKVFDEHDYTDFTPTWYETAAITGLNIRNDDGTAETPLGTGGNRYMIQGNPFLQSQTASTNS